MVTLDNHSPTHPPTNTVDILPSPAGFSSPQFLVPQSCVSVGEPKHSPRSPIHVLVRCLIPPLQVLEQELKELQLDHFFLLPLLHKTLDLHSSTCVVSPRQVLSLLGTTRKITVFAVFGEEQLLCLSLFPFPQLEEHELQDPHLLQLTSSFCNAF